MVDPAGIGLATKDVINNNTKVRMAAHNFGISKTLRHHFFKFQEREKPY
jgi:hypothetical protein